MLAGLNESKCFVRQVKGEFWLALLLGHVSSHVQSWKSEKRNLKEKSPEDKDRQIKETQQP